MKKVIKFAFIQTLPVLFGYLFLGTAFGLMLQKAGYSAVWAFVCSLVIYAGSGQYLLVSLLSGGAGLAATAAMTLLINSRHIFYGLSFVEKFQKMGKAYPYMIFSLTDETYSLLCYTKIPEELNQQKVTFAIAALDQLYWLSGSVLGALLGQLITFDSTGVDFAMTALFTVICVEQWLEYKNHIPAVTGFVSGFVCLLIFGADHFILPSLIGTVGILLVLKNYIKTNDEREVENHAH